MPLCISVDLIVPLLAEISYGVEYNDNESTIVSNPSHPELLCLLARTAKCNVFVSDFFPYFYQSTLTIQTDGEGGGFTTDSTIADTTSIVSVQSSVSTRSSRSGLTRQGNLTIMVIKQLRVINA